MSNLKHELIVKSWHGTDPVGNSLGRWAVIWSRKASGGKTNDKPCPLRVTNPSCTTFWGRSLFLWREFETYSISAGFKCRFWITGDAGDVWSPGCHPHGVAAIWRFTCNGHIVGGDGGLQRIELAQIVISWLSSSIESVIILVVWYYSML